MTHEETLQFQPYDQRFERDKHLGESYGAELLANAFELLKTQKNKLGFGQTAEVHSLDSNPDHCLKIIVISERYTTVKPFEGSKELPRYHSLPNEAEYLSELQGLDPDVRVPKPYYTIVRESVDEEGERYTKEEIDILAMERLLAVSVRDVIEGRAELPKNFNFEKYFKQLRNFCERMHAVGVYHRDLHDGNVMIDVETGAPYVIDFGQATRDTTPEGAYREERRGKIFRYPSDIFNLDATEKKLRLFLGTEVVEG